VSIPIHASGVGQEQWVTVKWLAFVSLCFMFVAAGSVTQTRCALSVGSHVELRSPLDDPHVLLWRTRALLADYLVNQFGVSVAMRDTMLLTPDTRTIVTAACPSGDRTLVGIRVLNGPHARSYGWVDANDVLP